MAREFEPIVGEWLGEASADPDEVKARLDELHEQLASGVVDAEEQVSYVDPDEAAAVKQAGVTLAALVARRSARKSYVAIPPARGSRSSAVTPYLSPRSARDLGAIVVAIARIADTLIADRRMLA